MFRNLRQYCLGDGLCVHCRITMHAFADALQKGVATPERTVFRQSPTFVIKPAKQDWQVISEKHRFMRGNCSGSREFERLPGQGEADRFEGADGAAAGCLYCGADVGIELGAPLGAKAVGDLSKHGARA